MRLLLVTLALLTLSACGYVPHAPNIQPKFSGNQKIDITYSFNTYGGEYDDARNAVANNNFWFYDDALKRIQEDFDSNPMIGKATYRENAKPDTFHLEIDYYFKSNDQGVGGMFLSVVTLGIIPFYVDVERQLTVKVRDPEGFPAGNVLQEVTGTQQGGWFTLFQGSSFAPSDTKGIIIEQISENLEVAIYKLQEKGIFSGNF